MRRRTNIGGQLGDLKVFAGSRRGELEAARGLLTQVTLQPGEVLLRQGGIGNEFLIVTDGLISVTRDDGEEAKLLGMVGPGEVLGEMSLLHRQPRSATAITMVPTTLLAATPREFFALLHAAPAAAERIIGAANERMLANDAA